MNCPTLVELNAAPGSFDVIMGAMYYRSASADLLGRLADEAAAKCRTQTGLEWAWVGPRAAGYEANIPTIRVFDHNSATVAMIA